MKEIGKDIIAQDLVEGVAKAVLSSVPFVNYFVQVADSVKDNVLQRRYDKWREMVGQRLSELSQDVLSKLGNNENFATILIKTTELAAKTNGKKMEYLANAVKYAAENDIDEDTLIIMLNCIEKYTLSHITLLKYLENPSSYSNGKSYLAGGLLTYFDDYYPDFDKKLQNIILKDLFRDGLTTTDINGTMTSSGMNIKRTTELGDLFIILFGVENDGK